METTDLFELIDRIENSGLTRFRMRDGEFELEMERGSDGQAGITVHGQRSQGADTAEARDGGEENRGAATAGAGQAEGETAAVESITSPIVGAFYRAPSPDAPPYVEAGSEVEQGQTLCIIEAMKVMNELEAEFRCRIVRVLVENQQMVEYGTPLFEVERLD
jgi:acetyl-CoA carboxylase biotin carboxyl carrier protein